MKTVTKTTITKDRLKKLYKNWTNKEVCKKLGVSETTLIRYLKESGIKTKGRGNRSKIRKVLIKGI